MDFKSELYSQLADIVRELAGASRDFVLETPEDSTHGDYSTNAPLVLFSKNKELRIKNNEWKSPRALAEKIKLEIENQKLEFLGAIEIAGPGFLNFTLTRQSLIKTLESIGDKKDSFGQNTSQSGTKVITEFTDPNPFKEFHIGHLYSNSVGESISRLIESQGAELKRVCYQGDVGLHVAKALWGVTSLLKESGNSMEDMAKKSLHERAEFLGQAYARGARVYEDSEDAKKEIIEINKKVFAKDPEVMDMYTEGRAWSLAYFETIYARLGTHFDNYFFESEVGDTGKKLVLGYLEKGVFEESNGAVIFPGEKHGLHNRVFINSLGLPTYEAKELGLAPAKYEYFPYDRSIVITGNEINEYFKVLLKALESIRPELAESTVHIGHGMVRLPQGKMSSRTGNVITGEWLLDEAKAKVQERMKDQEDVDQISEKVAVAAVKYALLKSGIGANIAFSFDESISFEGNSGPYLQYTFVRTKSILKNLQSPISNFQLNSNTQLNQEEEEVLRHLIHFPEVVAHAATTYSPHHVCEYLYKLAQKFNLFYAKHKIVGADNEQFRIALTAGVGQILKNGLTILGIPIVEKM